MEKYIVGKQYTRTQIRKIENAPGTQGKWVKGYFEHNGEIFIFSNFGGKSYTGVDHGDHWIDEKEGIFNWNGMKKSSIENKDIKKMLDTDTKVNLFIRNANPKKGDPFTYLGSVIPILVRGKNPVNIIWQVGYSDVPLIEKDELKMEKELIDYKNDLFSSDDTMVQKERERIKRSQKLKEYVIRKNNFQCEINFEHHSFISERTKRNYVETHHIIPLSVQKYGEYDYKLDCEANLSCLCPNCHKLLHYGTWAEKEPLLQQLFNQHVKALIESNIDIASIDSISFYYKD